MADVIKFIEQKIPGIETLIVAPDFYEIIGVENENVKYFDKKENKIGLDEPLFIQGQDKVYLNKFRYYYPRELVIVVLFSPNNNLYLQVRGKNKQWEPNKIDLASIAEHRRALLKNGKFENEDLLETANRGVFEEIGIDLKKEYENKFTKIGEFYLDSLKAYHYIYALKIKYDLETINKNINKYEGDETGHWFEQGYKFTINDYFSKNIIKYAGGEELRPNNFISNNEIKNNLDSFFDKFKNGE